MKERLNSNPIQTTLTAHLQEENSVFVFPTQTSATLWADRIIQVSDTKAIATERFIAWDDFKGSSIKSQHEDKRSIPATLRKFFANTMIEENAKAPFLTNIITKEYAASASSFTNWIAGFLPSLSQWKKRFTDRIQETDADDEDKDLLAIYDWYSRFLDENGLFDPAWETPPFEADGHTYYIFYPEILMDYSEYAELLASSPDIVLVHVPEAAGQKEPEVQFFSSSKEEISAVAMHLLHAHNDEGIPWTSIAISVPDIETYAPYLTQTFTSLEIPHVLRNGVSLASTGAGSFFVQAAACVRTNFSFDSIKTLLSNNQLPWIQKTLNNELINFGKENNCLCSFTEPNGQPYDVWEMAFKQPNQNLLLINFYRSLKDKLTPLARSKTFADILKNYFSFRELFFNQDEWDEQSNNIMSRCITELNGLIDLEQEFPNCTVASPYSFFTSYLEDKMYVPQQSEQGVQVITYRLASSAPFAKHIVLDASQSSLSVIYKQIGFLNDTKRKKLGFTEDTNVSELFIRLYSLSSDTEPFYTCAEKTFTGYALPHGCFKEVERRKDKDDFVPLDDAENPEIQNPYKREKQLLLKQSEDGKNITLPDCVPMYQKQSFENWYGQNFIEPQESSNTDSSSAFGELLKAKCHDANGKIKISATPLRDFYVCPRLWLFKRILGVKELSSEGSLMDIYTMGNLNHEMLHLYMEALQSARKPLHAKEDSLTDEYLKLLSASVDKAIATLRNTSPLLRELLKTERDSIFATIEGSVIEVSHWFEDFSVIATEKEYSFAPDNKDYVLNGKIDCLLSSPEGEPVLLDFKNTGMAVPKKELYKTDTSLPDPQMPMYIYLLQNQKKPISIENAFFYAIKDKNIVPVLGTATNNYKNGTKTAKVSDFTPTMEAFLDMVETFAQRIQAKDFSLDEAAQTYSVCTDTDCRNYRPICRRFFTVSTEK